MTDRSRTTGLSSTCEVAPLTTRPKRPGGRGVGGGWGVGGGSGGRGDAHSCHSGGGRVTTGALSWLVNVTAWGPLDSPTPPRWPSG